jgi:starch synthase
MPENKYTPAYDNKIFQKYSAKTLANKDANKNAFCSDHGLSYNKKVPILAITYPLTDQNNVSLLQAIMPGVLEQPVQVVLMGIGTAKYQQFFTELAQKYPQKIVIDGTADDDKRKIYAAADIMLIPGDSAECLEEAQNAMQYGAIPVIIEQPFVSDYSPVDEKGNAFVYEKNHPWGFFAAFIRALENFHFPYDWKNIQIEAMQG